METSGTEKFFQEIDNELTLIRKDKIRILETPSFSKEEIRQMRDLLFKPQSNGMFNLCRRWLATYDLLRAELVEERIARQTFEDQDQDWD